jgi:hypothetical protein
MTMTLDGLEHVVRSAVPRRVRVNFIRYADDFIITAKSRRLLEEHIIPAVKRFLAERDGICEGLCRQAEGQTMLNICSVAITSQGRTGCRIKARDLACCLGMPVGRHLTSASQLDGMRMRAGGVQLAHTLIPFALSIH